MCLRALAGTVCKVYTVCIQVYLYVVILVVGISNGYLGVWVLPGTVCKMYTVCTWRDSHVCLTQYNTNNQ